MVAQPIPSSSSTSSEPIRELPSHLGAFEFIRIMQRDPLGLFVDLWDAHGDIASVDLKAIRVVLLRHPDDVYHVLVKNAANYNKKSRGYKVLRSILGNGLVTSEGEFWKRQRRIAQPAFHRSRLARLAGVMVEEAERLLVAWEPMAKRRQVVDVGEEMMKVTMQIVCRTLLGVDAGVRNKSLDIGAAVGLLQGHVSYKTRRLVTLPDFVPSPGNLRFGRARKMLDGVVQQIIEERRASGEAGDDLLGMFMEVQDQDTGERMTDQQLLDEVKTMFLAGHETTAMNLMWTLYLLSQHPQEAARLRAELRQVLGGRAPGFEDLGRLPYLDAVVKESLRLYPPVVMMARLAAGDDVIGDYRVPAGSYMVLSPYATHRHPGFWKRAARFEPERFLEDRKQEINRRAYFPFSTGQRKCIGDNFALMEARLILATLLQRVTPRLVPGHPVEMEPQITLKARYGMKMRLEETLAD